ncbi:MAG: SH3 domain-containing protein [Hyphomicrobiaceae bacterium]
MSRLLSQYRYSRDATELSSWDDTTMNMHNIFAIGTAVLLLAVAPHMVQAGDQIRTACVSGVAPGSWLNVRSNAFRSSPIIGRLQSGTCGIRVIGICGKSEWCSISFGAIRAGVVSGRYLKLRNASGPGMGRGQGAACGWYAIGSCSRNYRAARRVARQIGGDVVNTSSPNYPNFRPGWQCAVVGPLEREVAQASAEQMRYSSVPSAYAKSSC